MQLTIEQALKQAVAAHKAGRLSEAEQIYRAILQSQPKHSDANHNLGVIAVSLNQIEAAVPLLKTALDANPDVQQFWLSYVDALVKADRIKDAKQAIKRAKKRGFDAKKLARLLSHSKRGSDSDAEDHFKLGNTLRGFGKLKDAVASYNHAIALKPDFAEAHNNLGSTLKALGRLKEAVISYNQAIELKPDFAEAHYNKGNAQQDLGRVNEAESSYNRAIALKPDFAQAYRQLTIIKKVDRHDDQFLKMLELHRDKALSVEQRCQVNFGLAKAYEDLENYERAFNHYVEGNELRKTLLNYDINQDLKVFEEIKSSYPRLEQHQFEPSQLARSITPIFIIGMPRSGTTLVEQVVSSHALVTGAGELPFVDLLGSAIATGASDTGHNALLDFRMAYLNKLKDYAQGMLWATDKMPLNFRYLGLLVKAIPEAKFIHVKRRPEAVCWGNYKTDFSDKSLGYSWSIDDVVTYYELYQSLMGFWQSELIDKVYDLDYELLTDNQELETRKLIDFIGLGWDENCLCPESNTRSVSTASNLQVRQKVYKGSSNRWRNYEPFLDGAFDGL